MSMITKQWPGRTVNPCEGIDPGVIILIPRVFQDLIDGLDLPDGGQRPDGETAPDEER